MAEFDIGAASELEHTQAETNKSKMTICQDLITEVSLKTVTPTMIWRWSNYRWVAVNAHLKEMREIAAQRQ